MSNLVVHKVKVHNQLSTDEETQPDEERFECKTCGEKFRRRSLLATHEEQVHSTFKGRTINSRKGRASMSNGRNLQVNFHNVFRISL